MRNIHNVKRTEISLKRETPSRVTDEIYHNCHGDHDENDDYRNDNNYNYDYHFYYLIAQYWLFFNKYWFFYGQTVKP